MIFEIIVELQVLVMRDVHFSGQCAGVGLVVLKLGLGGCYCGCRTPLMHGRTFQGWGSIPREEMSTIVTQNLSRLGFDSLIRDEYYYVCEHLNNFLCCQKVCLLFMLIAKLQLSFIIEQSDLPMLPKTYSQLIYHLKLPRLLPYTQMPQPNMLFVEKHYTRGCQKNKLLCSHKF